MIYTQKIQEAIVFSIKTHEIDQKQKRKGKDIPYITHPLTVGLILSRAGADEDTVTAGILHDTIEDSMVENKVTVEILEEKFGKEVAVLVASVTEMNKDLSWEKRKAEALEHVKTMSHNSLLLKSADLLSNSTELIADYARDGENVFSRFNAPKEKIIKSHLLMIHAIIQKWPESPLVDDLQKITRVLSRMDYPYLSLGHLGGTEQISLPHDIHDEEELINIALEYCKERKIGANLHPHLVISATRKISLNKQEQNI